MKRLQFPKFYRFFRTTICFCALYFCIMRWRMKVAAFHFYEYFSLLLSASYIFGCPYTKLGCSYCERDFRSVCFAPTMSFFWLYFPTKYFSSSSSSPPFLLVSLNIFFVGSLVLICGEVLPTAFFTGPRQLQIASRFTW